MKKLYLLPLLIPFLWACGYRLAGTGASIIPDDAKTIMVPLFENRSTSAGAAGFVTESLRDGLVHRSGLDLVFDGSAADLVLEGTITNFNVTPVSVYAQGGAAQYQVLVSIEIRLIDNRDNRLLYERRDLSYQDVYKTDQGNFFSMETDTLKRIAKAMSSGLLSIMFNDF